MPSTVILVGLGLVLAAIAYRVLSGGVGHATFVIDVGEAPDADSGDEHITLKGSVPGKSDADARAFIAGLELPKGARIWGVPDGDRLRIRFRDVPDNLQQRVRNYVYN